MQSKLDMKRDSCLNYLQPLVPYLQIASNTDASTLTGIHATANKGIGSVPVPEYVPAAQATHALLPVSNFLSNFAPED